MNTINGVHRIVLFISFGIILSSLTSQIFEKENRLFWDGGDWRRISKRVQGNTEMEYRIKSAYISGVLDGRLFYYLKSWGVKQSFSDSLYSDPIDYLTPRQMIGTIDKFYREPTNVFIPVVSAMIIANLYGEQVSQSTIDAYVTQTKFWINQFMLDMEEEGMGKLLEEKQKNYLERKY